jgi:hypothetical protein
MIVGHTSYEVTVSAPRTSFGILLCRTTSSMGMNWARIGAGVYTHHPVNAL